MTKWTYSGGNQKIDLTNGKFIKAIFGEDRFRCHVTGFQEDPTTLDTSGRRHYWGGGPWSTASGLIQDPHNNFFTISVFKPDPADNKYRRRKVAFDKCYAIVFDDINLRGVDPSETSAKVDPDKIELAPSWVLETSPYNFQVGYIIRDGDTRGGKVTALLEGLVATGLVADGSDPGMKGVTRYVRLPKGRNTKAKYGSMGFEQVLTAWHPDRQYSLEDLARAHDIKDEFDAAPDDIGAGGAPNVDPENDWILDVLSKSGRILSEDRTKKLWHVECPFVEDHTARENSGTAYLGAGLWTCHHGHCVDRDHQEFTDRLRLLFPTESGRAVQDVAKRMFDDGTVYEKGVPERVRIEEEIDEVRDLFGDAAADAHKDKRELGPFQKRMSFGFSLSAAIKEGVTLSEAWLLKGVCPPQGMGVLYGDPGAGKSFIALDMMARSVTGLDWQGNVWKREGLALYVGSEGGHTGLKHRLLAWAKQHDKGSDDLMVYPGAFALGGGDENVKEVGLLIKWLKSWSRQAGKPVTMVTLDTLNRNMVGDENSTSDMTATIQACDRIARELGCFVWLVHHTGKDASRGARGSSALRGATDVEIRIERDDQTASGVLYLNKNRHGEDGKQWGFELNQISLGVDDDGDEILSMCVSETSVASTSTTRNPSNRLGDMEKAVIRTFNDMTGGGPGPVSLDELVKRTRSDVQAGKHPDLNFNTGYPAAEYKRKVKKSLVPKGVFMFREDSNEIALNRMDFAQVMPQNVDENEE